MAPLLAWALVPLGCASFDVPGSFLQLQSAAQSFQLAAAAQLGGPLDLLQGWPPQFKAVDVGALWATEETNAVVGASELATRFADSTLAGTVGAHVGPTYGAEVLGAALATTALLLPAVAWVGERERVRRGRLDVEAPVDFEVPYAGGADSYDPAAADIFYGKRPLMVVERLVGLVQATAAFQVQLLMDWRFGNLEKNQPVRAREALALVNELGPTFIKLGQALSIRTDLIPEAYALELRQLQDAVPPFPDAVAKAILRSSFGVQSLDEIFESVSERPIASASIGQVYRATLKPGSYGVVQNDGMSPDVDRGLGPVASVALKVQRPNVLAEIALDLYLLRLLTPVQARISNWINRVPTEQADIDVALALVDEWGRGFVNEVDYFAEARNTDEFSAAMKARGLGAVVAPRVVKELLRRNILVTEWIDGTRLDASASPDVPRLCGVAINAYLTMLLDTGTLHCDPHPGNLLRTLDGRLCILDWGMTLQVPKDLQYALLEFIAHINTNNLDEVPQDFVNLGFTPPDKLEQVRSSGVTDGLSFMLRQLSGGGGPSKIRERVKAEFVTLYGDVSDEELREKAREDMIKRMETQLAAEGVDVRGVSNVMEEMSRRNRELFQLPTWVLYVVRAFSTLEGIGLSVDEDYAIIQECYPYLARRLFKDDSVRARKALYAMLYGAPDEDAPNDGASHQGLDLDKLSEMLDGFSSYSTATSGAELALGQSADAAARAGAAAMDAQRELASVVLAKDGNYVQDLLLEESARFIDASVRAAVYDALQATPLIARAAPASQSPSLLGGAPPAGDVAADADLLRRAVAALRGELELVDKTDGPRDAARAEITFADEDMHARGAALARVEFAVEARTMAARRVAAVLESVDVERLQVREREVRLGRGDLALPAGIPGELTLVGHKSVRAALLVAQRYQDLAFLCEAPRRGGGEDAFE
mmetsp:Transcript_20979/g.72254  ORF Transcript_20979/g.72254 Transcript_20979/m.72254 type:complete len:940 (-) Transcript_20979:437-3256(-)